MNPEHVASGPGYDQHRVSVTAGRFLQVPKRELRMFVQSDCNRDRVDRPDFGSVAKAKNRSAPVP
jgi:hypothetical protein